MAVPSPETEETEPFTRRLERSTVPMLRTGVSRGSNPRIATKSGVGLVTAVAGPSFFKKNIKALNHQNIENS